MPKARRRTQVAQSIRDFMKAKKRSKCRVCQLPAPVREQLTIAREDGLSLAEQVEYLAALGLKITRQELMAHSNGRHDDE